MVAGACAQVLSPEGSVDPTLPPWINSRLVPVHRSSVLDRQIIQRTDEWLLLAGPLTDSHISPTIHIKQ